MLERFRTVQLFCNASGERLKRNIGFVGVSIFVCRTDRILPGSDLCSLVGRMKILDCLSLYVSGIFGVIPSSGSVFATAGV